MSNWYLDDPDHEPTQRHRRRNEEKNKRKQMLLDKGWGKIETKGRNGRIIEHWISPHTGIKYNYLNAKNIEELRIALNRRDYI